MPLKSNIVQSNELISLSNINENRKIIHLIASAGDEIIDATYNGVSNVYSAYDFEIL